MKVNIVNVTTSASIRTSLEVAIGRQDTPSRQYLTIFSIGDGRNEVFDFAFEAVTWNMVL